MKAFPIDERIGLESSLDYLETLLTHDASGFAFFDADLRCARACEKMGAIHGQFPAAYLGRRAEEIAPAEQWPACRSILEDALAGSATLDAPLSPMPLTAGRHIRASYYPVTSGEVVLGVALVVRDVTAQTAAETELRQRALAFENTSDSLIITSLDGAILQVNEGFSVMTGYSPEEVIGCNAEMLHHPAGSERLVANILSGLHRDGHWTGNVPMVHKDGSTRFSETNIAALVDENGVLIGAINASRDVTSRLRDTQILRETQMRKDVILGAALDAVITIDEAERVMEWNLAAEKIFGYTRAEAMDQPLSTLIIPERLRGAHERGIEHYLQTGEGPALFQRIEVPALRKDGTEFAAELTAMPIDLPGRSLFTAFVRDISERKQAEADLKAAVARQRTLLRDVLMSVTEEKLHLLEEEAHLPVMAALIGDPVMLTTETGLSALRAAAMDAARDAGYTSERCYDLMTAASEAGMNAIVHAGGGVAQIGVGTEGVLQVRVTDHGAGISLENLPQATLARGFSTKSTLGHGLKMMLETIDRLSLLTGPTGTIVVLEQYPERPLPRWLAL